MKVVIALCLIGAAFAAPDSNLRQLVGYQDTTSSVSILRGADLERRGDDSGEVRAAPRVQVVAQRPVHRRVEVVRQPAQQIVYQAPRPVVYQAPAPRQVVYQAPAPRPVVYQAPAVQRVVYQQAPAPQPIVYRRPEPTQVVYQAPVPPRVVKQRAYRVREDSREYADSDAKYQFAYEVADEYNRNYQSRQESRDGHRVQGVYTVLDPDGQLRTVKYGDDGNGFYAAVSREPSNIYGGGQQQQQYAYATPAQVGGSNIRDDSNEHSSRTK